MDQKFAEVMDAVRDCRDDIRVLKEDVRLGHEKRDQQHVELLALIRALQGSTSQSYRDGPPFGDRDFTPTDRPGGHQDGTGPDTGRGGTGRTDHSSQQLHDPIQFQDFTPYQPSRTLHAPEHFQDFTPDPSSRLPHDPVHFHDPIPHERTPSVEARAVLPSRPSSRRDLVPHGTTLRSSPADQREGSSSSHRIDPTDDYQTPPPLRRQDRIRRRGWQQRSPYTDPCQPKRPRMMPPPAQTWMPNALVDPDQLAAYYAYKRNDNKEL